MRNVVAGPNVDSIFLHRGSSEEAKRKRHARAVECGMAADRRFARSLLDCFPFCSPFAFALVLPGKACSLYFRLGALHEFVRFHPFRVRKIAEICGFEGLRKFPLSGHGSALPFIAKGDPRLRISFEQRPSGRGGAARRGADSPCSDRLSPRQPQPLPRAVALQKKRAKPRDRFRRFALFVYLYFRRPGFARR